MASFSVGPSHYGGTDAPVDGAFDFDFVRRNDLLLRTGLSMTKAQKTGTTIVGVTYKDGVVLGADTRATEGDIVADKNCDKIHYIAPNIYCCGAGTSADTESSTGLISSQLELHRFTTGRQSRVITALTLLKQMLFRYQGHVSAALILGGVDITGPSLYTIYPHGSTDRLPFVTMGSGSLAAMGVFESQWRPNMTRDEAVALVRQAIEAGIFNDLGSGGNVDVCVLTKDKVEYLRNKPEERFNERKFRRPGGYVFPRGTTEIKKSVTQLFEPAAAAAAAAAGGEGADAMLVG